MRFDLRTHPNACIGDFPHIGVDSNGIFVTTNGYCLFCPGIGFHAAQVYALDKRALARGAATVALTQIDTVGMQSGKPGFTLWPATSPTAADFELAAGGTEYFTSSNAAEEVSGAPNAVGTNKSDQIVVWALSNTASLTSAHQRCDYVTPRWAWISTLFRAHPTRSPAISRSVYA